MTEKPLHVRVAEALGWKNVADVTRAVGLGQSMWLGEPPPGDMAGTLYVAHVDQGERSLTIGSGSVPRYDTDWSATGPLIEKYGICLTWWAERGRIVRWDASDNIPEQSQHLESGPTPLVAVCNLLLTLAQNGSLAA